MQKDDELLYIEPKADYPSQINARTKVIDILTKVETRQAFTDKLLERELISLNDNDRRFVTEIVNGVLRWRLRLDWYLNQLYSGDYENLILEVKNNLRSSVYQLVYLDKIPPYAVLYEAVEIAKMRYNQKTANLVNAVLRNYLRQSKKFDILETQLDILDKLAIKFSHPKWLLQRWIEYWGIDEVSLLCQVNNTPPRVAVRLNELKANKEQFFSSLEENNISFEVQEDFKNFVWIDNFQEFRQMDFLKNGWANVQDVSTGLPVLILDPQPGEFVLDMCAAPGGKTSYIAEKMQNTGVILALDRHIPRIRMLRDNLFRLKFSNYNIAAADSLSLPSKIQFDKILIDAPCTGFGVLNKRADLKWKRTEQDISDMKKLQINLLKSATSVLKENGLIVYSTCTIEPEENERVVEEFLNAHSDFKLVKLSNLIPMKYLSDQYFIRTFPHKHGMDGSFAAAFQKNLN